MFFNNVNGITVKSNGMEFLGMENKIAFMSCVELVLVKRDDTNYNLVLAKLQSLYNHGILECLDNPERLRTVLKEVYNKGYNYVLDDISAETKKLVDMDKFKDNFFKVMES